MIDFLDVLLTVAAICVGISAVIFMVIVLILVVRGELK